MILLLPAAVLLATTDPLWRDIDAAVQVSHPPSFATLVHFPPLYCFGSRIPLLLGALFENGSVASDFFIRPTLTPTGVLLLVLSQQLAGAGAVAFLIGATTRSRLMQGAFLALFLAQGWFWTFLHCVGSEALSLVLIVLACGAVIGGVRSREPSGRGLLAVMFYGSVFLAVLTRHINVLLLVIPPLAGVLAALAERAEWRVRLRGCGIAMAFGVVVLMSSGLVGDGVARVGGVEPGGTLGLTFRWRTACLARSLPPAEAGALFERCASAASDPAVAALLRRFGGAVMAGTLLTTDRQLGFASAEASAAGRPEASGELLSALPIVLFRHGGLPLWQNIAGDIVNVPARTAADVAVYPFHSTIYLVDDRYRGMVSEHPEVLAMSADRKDRLVSRSRWIQRQVWLAWPVWALFLLSISAALAARSPLEPAV